jgi:hypothetical protein
MDSWAFSAGAAAGGVIGVVVALVIGLSLTGIVANTVKSNTGATGTGANLTTDQKNILGLTPTFYVLGIAILGIGVVFVALHQALSE